MACDDAVNGSQPSSRALLACKRHCEHVQRNLKGAEADKFARESIGCKEGDNYCMQTHEGNRRQPMLAWTKVVLSATRPHGPATRQTVILRNI